MFGRIKISNEECISTLIEINGVIPEDWFVAVNKGKDKKVHYAFIVNNTDYAVQLVPIKKENKKLVIDKENIIILSKLDDIKKCIVLIEDTHDHFYIHLNNGFKFRLVIRKSQFDKNRRKIYKSFRKQFSKQSLVPQILDVVFNVSIVLLSLIAIFWSFLKIPNNTLLYKHYAAAYDLKQTVDSGYFDEYMTVTLEQYPYSNLKFENNFSAITHGQLQMNLPSDCKLDKDALEDSIIESFATYTTGIEKKTALSVMVDSQPIDFSNNDIEGYAALKDALRDTAIKEFGVSLDNHYNLTKAMWQMNSLEDNINYFSRNEVALYRFMLVMKMTMSSGVNNYYEINTPSYCGFVSIRNFGDNNNLATVNLDVFSYDNLNESYQITIIVKNGDINDAFKIINSVELLTE